MTRAGLELKAVIDQMREQVQNIEYAASSASRAPARDRAPRAAAGAVLAVRRRQDHAVAPPARAPTRDLRMSVSVTTRPPRPGEVDGTDYRFIDAAEFERDGRRRASCSSGPRSTAISTARRGRRWRRRSTAGQDVLFDIDWQGAQQLSDGSAPTWCASSSCRPAVEELERRLRRAPRTPPRWSPGGWPQPRRDQPLARIRLRHRQRGPGREPCAASPPSSPPSALQARAPDRARRLRARLLRDL